MYPYLRTAWILARTPLTPGMRPDDATELTLTCQLWDADMFGEMNNGRHLTLFDIGRLHYGKRFGFLKMLRENRWGLVVGGSTIQYRKRIHPFQRFTLHTRCLGRDDKWFYFQQTTLRQGVACSSALVRTAVISGPKGVMPTQAVADAMGWSDWRGVLPDWAAKWDAMDRSRPWPPELEPPDTTRPGSQPANRAPSGS